MYLLRSCFLCCFLSLFISFYISPLFWCLRVSCFLSLCVAFLLCLFPSSFVFFVISCFAFFRAFLCLALSFSSVIYFLGSFCSSLCIGRFVSEFTCCIISVLARVLSVCLFSLHSFLRFFFPAFFIHVVISWCRSFFLNHTRCVFLSCVLSLLVYCSCLSCFLSIICVFFWLLLPLWCLSLILLVLTVSYFFHYLFHSLFSLSYSFVIYLVVFLYSPIDVFLCFWRCFVLVVFLSLISCVLPSFLSFYLSFFVSSFRQIFLCCVLGPSFELLSCLTGRYFVFLSQFVILLIIFISCLLCFLLDLFLSVICYFPLAFFLPFCLCFIRCFFAPCFLSCLLHVFFACIWFWFSFAATPRETWRVRALASFVGLGAQGRGNRRGVETRASDPRLADELCPLLRCRRGRSGWLPRERPDLGPHGQPRQRRGPQ